MTISGLRVLSLLRLQKLQRMCPVTPSQASFPQTPPQDHCTDILLYASHIHNGLAPATVPESLFANEGQAKGSFLFVTSTQAKLTWEEGISIEKEPLSDWSVGKPVGTFSWLVIGVGKLSPTGAGPPLSRWSWVV